MNTDLKREVIMMHYCIDYVMINTIHVQFSVCVRVSFSDLLL